MNLGFQKGFWSHKRSDNYKATGLMGGLTVQLLLNGSMRKSNNLFLTVVMIRTGNIILAFTAVSPVNCCKSCNTT